MKHTEFLDLPHLGTEELQEWQSFANRRKTEVLGKEETCNP